MASYFSQVKLQLVVSQAFLYALESSIAISLDRNQVCVIIPQHCPIPMCRTKPFGVPATVSQITIESPSSTLSIPDLCQGTCLSSKSFFPGFYVCHFNGQGCRTCANNMDVQERKAKAEIAQKKNLRDNEWKRHVLGDALTLKK